LDGLIKQQYNDPDFMKFIFGIIANFHAERRLQFVASYLEHNKRFEDFQRMALEPNTYVMSIPTLQKRADYFESIHSHLNEVQLLQHKLHVERIIQGIRMQIEWEKKKDFIGD
jgi:hypothetical protein